MWLFVTRSTHKPTCRRRRRRYLDQRIVQLDKEIKNNSQNQILHSVVFYTARFSQRHFVK